MCNVRGRIITLTAIRDYLQGEVARLRDVDGQQDTLEKRVEDLEMVEEELTVLLGGLAERWRLVNAPEQHLEKLEAVGRN